MQNFKFKFYFSNILIIFKSDLIIELPKRLDGPTKIAKSGRQGEWPAHAKIVLGAADEGTDRARHEENGAVRDEREPDRGHDGDRHPEEALDPRVRGQRETSRNLQTMRSLCQVLQCRLQQSHG